MKRRRKEEEGEGEMDTGKLALTTNTVILPTTKWNRGRKRREK